MHSPPLQSNRITFLSTAMLAALTLAACSREQQPIAEAIKPAQQTMEKAKGVEQTLQKAHETRETQATKE